MAFGVQVEEGIDDAAGIVLVQREVGPLPVAAGAKFAELLQDDLEAKGPVKVSDVESAQKDIITIARRMAEAGEISLGGAGEEMM